VSGYSFVYSLFCNGHTGVDANHKAISERQTNAIGETGQEV